MTLRALFGMLVLVLLTAVACQNGESPVASGGRAIAPSTLPPELDLSDPQDIGTALDYCLDDGTGQGNAAETRYLNAIDKYNGGDIEGAQNAISTLIEWGYERYDLGKWQNPPCDDQDFVDVWTAVAQSVGINVDIALDGCVCTTDGCTCISNTACAGVVLPNSEGEAYFVSFDEIPFDPFLVTPAKFNLYDQWSEINVVDINGDPVSFSSVPATVATYVQDLNGFVTEEQLRLGHVKDGVMNILPLAQVTFSLSCTTGGVSANSFFDQVASIFHVTPLYGAGTKSGLLSSFSPIGPGDPHSDTSTEISPSGVELTDGQSQTFTATVAGVTAYDTSGNPYEPNDLQVGSPIEFYLDEATSAFATGSIDANGQASVSLTCGSDIGSGDHVISVVYPATEVSATSSTADGDSPTGPATVTCVLPFNLINFDRDPDGNPLKNGEIVNGVYASLGVQFSQLAVAGGSCQDGNVYAVSDPNAGNYGSPPRVVALCSDASPIDGSVHGKVVATFATPQTDVCITVFPTAGKGKNAAQGEITAYYTNGSSASKTDQSKSVCVSQKKFGGTTYLIDRVEFSGINGVAKFDNLRFKN